MRVDNLCNPWQGIRFPTPPALAQQGSCHRGAHPAASGKARFVALLIDFLAARRTLCEVGRACSARTDDGGTVQRPSVRLCCVRVVVSRDSYPREGWAGTSGFERFPDVCVEWLPLRRRPWSIPSRKYWQVRTQGSTRSVCNG